LTRAQALRQAILSRAFRAPSLIRSVEEEPCTT
jgi:hypothetical protein